MAELMSSTKIVVDIVNKAGTPVDAALIAKRLGIRRGAAGKCLSRAVKAGLIERAEKGWYKAKDKTE